MSKVELFSLAFRVPKQVPGPKIQINAAFDYVITLSGTQQTDALTFDASPGRIPKATGHSLDPSLTRAAAKIEASAASDDSWHLRHLCSLGSHREVVRLTAPAF